MNQRPSFWMFPTLKKTLAAALLLASCSYANAVTITSYDILRTPTSGFGNWFHTYNGTITPTGGDPSEFNYSGGSGTLNDGVIGTSESNTHLFSTAFNPVITLHLDQSYAIGSDLTLFSFNGPNGIPGNISAVDVTVNGVTATISTSNTGGRHELVSLVGSPLNGLVDDTIVLSNFQAGDTTFNSGNFSFPEYFSISEITVNGTPGSRVPDGGSSLLLLGFGALGCTIARRLKK